MEQIFLKIRLPDGKPFLLLTNTGMDYVRVWEDNLVTIGVSDPDIYNDTMRQLGSAQTVNLERLKTFLKQQIDQEPSSPDSIGFSQMLKAICKLLDSR